MEISTGDLIGFSSIGITALGGAVALGKIWSKVIDNARTTVSLTEKVDKLQEERAEDKTLTMVQESKIGRLEENSNKLFELAESQGKVLGEIRQELGIIITKLEAKNG